MLSIAQGRFAKLLSARMEKLQYSRKDVAEKTDRTVEHIRKLVAGETFPGTDLQRLFAEKLGLELEEVQTSVQHDRWYKKFHKKPPASDRNTFVSPITKLWGQLSDDQKDELACLAQCMARRNSGRRTARRTA